ncbi:hypothetical protein FOMG_19488 [Fusarium oxysporum f. sp. melonis 26406]|uniref:Uncharacterized protein n=1 Tax=Fusarium oxysporum f. sp. melonis 26406 TaxID=1089452 RepID=W9ZRK1_FUSOX|nr:hypothetical protein FOMG_19488 [Fusarium oxysporum f. sp. melonis 26406]
MRRTRRVRAVGSDAIGNRSCSSRYGGLHTQDTGSSRRGEPAAAAVEAAGAAGVAQERARVVFMSVPVSILGY